MNKKQEVSIGYTDMKTGITQQLKMPCIIEIVEKQLKKHNINLEPLRKIIETYYENGDKGNYRYENENENINFNVILKPDGKAISYMYKNKYESISYSIHYKSDNKTIFWIFATCSNLKYRFIIQID